MPDTPLNPDALEAAARALLAVQQPEVSADYAWNVQFDEGREELRKEAAAAVSVYLAAALPEVTSVEELDELPEGTILRDSYGLALHKRTANWWVTNCDSNLTSEDLADEIADTAHTYTVLYCPEVKP